MDGERERESALYQFSAQMQNIPGIINTFIEYNGEQMPFGIQPRCRLKRLKEVVGNALQLQVKKVTLKPLRSAVFPEKIKILEGDELFLIENHGVTEHAVLVVEGDRDPTKKEAKFDYPMMYISFVDEKDTVIHPKVQISTLCTVEMLLNMLKKTRSYIPETLSIWLGDRKLASNQVVSEVVKPEGKLTIKGKVFPLHLFDGYDFAENLGVYPSTECCICLEALTSSKVLKCGHANVCTKCAEQVTKCPLCG